MELDFVIFCVGVIGSVGPLYYALNYLDRRLRHSSSSSVIKDDGIIGQRHEFLMLLRREAAIRASIVLNEAVRQVLAAPCPDKQFQLNEEMIKRLHETGELVLCLLPRRAQLAYKRATHLLLQPSVDSTMLATNKINEQINTLDIAAGLTHRRSSSLPTNPSTSSKSIAVPQFAGSERA